MSTTDLPDWADGPWPLLETPSKTKNVNSHTAIFIANEMAHTHNVIIRGINSIYLQAPHVHSPTDISDFLFFTKCFCDFVEHHHRYQEDYLFPSIRTLAAQPDLFAKSISQHQSFKAGLQDLHQYALTTKPGSYSGSEVQDIINAFAPTLHQHLTDEIEELLELQSLDSVALMRIQEEGDRVKKFENADEMYPLFFGLVDKTYEGGVYDFPSVGFLVEEMVHHWYGRKHRGAWRFLPCDFWRQPRALQFTD